MSVTLHFIFLNKTYCKNIIQINLRDLLLGQYFIRVHIVRSGYRQTVKAVVNDRALSQTEFHGTVAQFFIPYTSCSHSSFNHIVAFFTGFLPLSHGFMGLISM